MKIWGILIAFSISTWANTHDMSFSLNQNLQFSFSSNDWVFMKPNSITKMQAEWTLHNLNVKFLVGAFNTEIAPIPYSTNFDAKKRAKSICSTYPKSFQGQNLQAQEVLAKGGVDFCHVTLQNKDFHSELFIFPRLPPGQKPAKAKMYFREILSFGYKSIDKAKARPQIDNLIASLKPIKKAKGKTPK